MSGQTVIVANADTVLHNMHLTSERNGEYNRAQLPKQHVSFTLRQPEVSVRLKCDVHPWEFGYICVSDHPFFAVTDADGRFEFPPGLPPGRYSIEARHLKAGAVTQEVAIARGERKRLEFTLEVPATAARPPTNF